MAIIATDWIHYFFLPVKNNFMNLSFMNLF